MEHIFGYGSENKSAKEIVIIESHVLALFRTKSLHVILLFSNLSVGVLSFYMMFHVFACPEAVYQGSVVAGIEL